MKKALVFFFFAVAVNTSKGQTSVYHPFPDSDAVWNISLYLTASCDTGIINEKYSYILAGDTVINSLLYQKLLLPFIYEIDTCNLYKPTTGYTGSIRQDTVAKKVFFVQPDSSSEDLLYDFNMQVGDTVRGYTENFLNGLGLYDLVNSIDSIFIGTSYRKRWNLTTCYNISFIEGIGSTYGVITQSPGCVSDMNEYSISCFQYEGQILYPDTGTNCSIITLIKPIDKHSNPINVFPNPSNGSFSIDFNKELINEIQLTDLLGNLIFRQFTGFESKFRIDNLSPGTYILTIIDKNNYATNKKILISP